MKIPAFLKFVPLLLLAGCAVDPYDFREPDPPYWRGVLRSPPGAPAFVVDSPSKIIPVEPPGVAAF